ncbi:ABC transporter substrate-binding protein [Arthrobacter mobilis]|uniref:ABC transporter substrate-binding protein n=1 Tax=Arthrobacter mobilis TaxID=2724944 RepID=A0A7X6HD52_9MICC|nr:ABC transporter substrate-binding protein [Arthrobacter mobilis]NKX54811.1 ABC transporter substrate-binding protein [Arthrobacter mobilis]
MTARQWSATLAALLVLVLASGCGVGRGSAVELGPGAQIKVGVIPVADFAPIYIAAEEGYFADEGLNVKTQVMQNAAAIAPSVINGQLQFGTAAVPPFLGAVQKGLPLKAVANGTSIAADPAKDPSALVAGPGNGITRPKDLEGRTVAVNALSSIVHVTAAAAVKADGGDPAKVTFVAMPFPDMLPALARGAVDAASLVEPFHARSVAEGARVIAHPYSKVLQPNGTFTVVFTAQPFIETNPGIVEKFARAVDRASVEAARNPQKVGAVLAKYGKLPPEVFARIRVPMYSDKLDTSALASTGELMRGLGFLPGSVDVESAVWK